MGITQEQVLKALSHVDDPDLKKDLVTLNMIRGIEIDGDRLRFQVVDCSGDGVVENGFVAFHLAANDIRHDFAHVPHDICTGYRTSVDQFAVLYLRTSNGID